MAFARRLLTRRNIAIAAGGSLATAGAASAVGYWWLTSGVPTRVSSKGPPKQWTPPTREEMINQLKSGEEFDLLVVGGGASGAGVALDAVSRGLKVALVERADFASGTSSKSTKLVHGGVRYLQKAVMELDYEQYKLVKEALHERRVFLETAPHLSSMLPILLPIYKFWQVPYYWAGCKMYDVLAGSENPNGSYVMSKRKTLETFPMLKSDGLVGSLVYYDGQHNDSRMNISLVMTAVQHGAIAANYLELTSLQPNNKVRDLLTGEEFEIKAKGVINATGPLSDSLLTLADPEHKAIVAPSSGTHIVLPSYYAPQKMGLLDPATSDGRVIFVLPWEGGVVAGTTDSPISLTETSNPGLGPNEKEINWILGEVAKYFGTEVDVRKEDVLSAWTGVRPLVRDPRKQGKTEGLVRNHIVFPTGTGLLTIAGGKWTTYREMARETVEEAIGFFNLKPSEKECQTEKLKLIGGHTWSPNLWINLVQKYEDLPLDVAKHISRSYGDRAWEVCELDMGGWKRLNDKYPYLEAEVSFAMKHEYAQHPMDILARRTRLAFIDSRAAHTALPRVADLMSKQLGWSKSDTFKEIMEGETYLKSSMGMGVAGFGPVERGEEQGRPKGMMMPVERSGGGV